ncbi:MAG: hypothetical protein ACRD3Q_18550 [Terriglobales bacterium]
MTEYLTDFLNVTIQSDPVNGIVRIAGTYESEARAEQVMLAILRRWPAEQYGTVLTLEGKRISGSRRA